MSVKGGPMTRREWGRLIAGFGAIYLIWGSTYLAIGVAVETVPPVLMVAVRGLLAGGLLYGWRRARGAAPVTGREMMAVAPTAALLFGGGYVLVGWAEQHVASGPAALLNSTTPAFVILLEWWKGARPRPGVRVILGLVAGVTGVVVLVLARQAGDSAVHPVAALLLVLASLAWATGTMRASAQKQGDALRSAAIQLLTGALILLPVSAALGEFQAVASTVPSARSLFALAYLVVFGSLIGYSAFVWLLEQVPASRVASHAYVNPLIAVLLGAWLVNEPLDVMTLVAAILIIGSVVTMVTDGARRQAKPEREEQAIAPGRPVKAA